MDRVLAIAIIVTFSLLFVLTATVGTVNPYVFLICVLLVVGAAFGILEETTRAMLTDWFERIVKWMERRD